MDTYVYGVIWAGVDRPPSGEGIDGRRVELVEHEGLAAIVSDAPSVPVKANRRNLMAHSRVLQAAVAEGCVLPMRFGMVMPKRAAVREKLLAPYHDRLERQLEAFEAYVEIDVRALCPEDALLRQVMAERTDIAELRASLDGHPPEATYYDRITLGEMVAQAVGAKREHVAARVLAALEPLAAATEQGEALHEQMLSNAAFLVDRERVSEFDAAADRIGRELGADVRLRSVGPLPPYNFVDMASEMEAESWA